MSIRSVTCPGCGEVANVPAAMANVKCPACATVWNVNLPESQRRLIYKDYRATARTNVEKPLSLPQGGPRMAVEGGLQAIFDREIRRFAALHDVTVEDIKEVIKEGDAKVWDGSPRSNATRDGKRVYVKEKSEGWKKSTNRK